MLQQSYHSTSAPPLQSEITATVHTWEAALVTARGGRDVDVYAAAMVPLLDALQRHTTIHALLTAYTAPDAALARQAKDLCDAGGAHLDPHVALGAACALRLRQLMDVAVA